VHIPNTRATRFDNTNSHLSDQINRHVQNNVSETEDSTYNPLGESSAHSPLSHRNDTGQLRRNPNEALTDDTYDHTYANFNKATNATLGTDHEDTYNHHEDIPTTYQNLQHGKEFKTESTFNGVSTNTNEKQKVAASGYNYSVVNKRTQRTNTTNQVDDAPRDFFVLEQEQETTGKPKPYDYAVVNKRSFAPKATSIPEDGPHEYYVNESSQSNATKPKSYDYAVVNKQSKGPMTLLANKYGPHKFFVVELNSMQGDKNETV